MALDKKFYQEHGFNLSNALGSGCQFMCITGGRGTGKTYCTKRYGIKRFIEHGEQFVYCRYYDEELKKITANPDPRSWFADIIKNEEFPEWDFRVNGRAMQAARKKDDPKKQEWHTMGQFMALCQAQAYKGNVTPDVHLLFLDEFIREKRGAPYPQGCVDALLGLWDTLDRRQDRVKVIMCANALDIVNPFYSEWHIIPPEAGKRKRVMVGEEPVYVEHAFDADFNAAVADSHIGRMTKGTSYGSWANDNRFANDSKEYVAPKPRRARPQANIMWDGQWLGVWMDLDTLGLWVELGYAKGANIEFCLYAKDAEPNILMIERSAPYLKSLAKQFRRGYLRFKNSQACNKTLEVLKLCGIR